MRVCIYYRKLNKTVIKYRFPLPLINDILDQLKRAEDFTTLDLKIVLFRVYVDPRSTKNAAFIMHDSQFEFLKVPFRLCSTQPTFSRYLACIFRELQVEGALILYMDDIIIASKTETKYLLKLRGVLETASNYVLKINFKKCQLLQGKIGTHNQAQYHRTLSH